MKVKKDMLGTVLFSSNTTHLLVDTDFPLFACYEKKGKEQPTMTYVRVAEDINRVSCKACQEILRKLNENSVSSTKTI